MVQSPRVRKSHVPRGVRWYLDPGPTTIESAARAHPSGGALRGSREYRWVRGIQQSPEGVPGQPWWFSMSSTSMTTSITSAFSA